MMCKFLKNHKKTFIIFLLGVISALAAVFVVKKKMAEPVVDEYEDFDGDVVAFDEDVAEV